MTTPKWILIYCASITLLTACAEGEKKPGQNVDGAYRSPSAYRETLSTVAEDAVQFFSTPVDMHNTFLEWIEAAQQSIEMEMFHLTDRLIVDALLAKDPKVKITLILDWRNIQSPGSAAIAKALSGSGHITVVPSSKLFHYTHTKAMIVDHATALITSINLTTLAATTRDYGIVTHDQGIINEMHSVFLQDVANATSSPQQNSTEGLTQPNLVWSPKNSESGLEDLIFQARLIPNTPVAPTPTNTNCHENSRRFIHATVENIGDFKIDTAMSLVATGAATPARGSSAPVEVRLIVPECAIGTGNGNYQYFKNMPGVKIRLAPAKATAEAPYMHGKMILLGNHKAYIGSVNYSKNSTQNDRELGIIFTNTVAAEQLDELFCKDWNNAADVNFDAGGNVIVPKCPGF